MFDVVASTLGSIIFIVIGLFCTIRYKKTNARFIASLEHRIRLLQEYPWITIVVGIAMISFGLVLLGVTLSQLMK